MVCMVDIEIEDEESEKTGRIALTIENIDIPDDDTAREELVSTIEETVREGVSENENINLSMDNVSATTGHEYAHLPAGCPKCGRSDRIYAKIPGPARDESRFSTDMGYVKVEDTPRTATKYECRGCGFEASAIFHLVDMETNRYSPELGGEIYRSMVADGEIEPVYESYE